MRILAYRSFVFSSSNDLFAGAVHQPRFPLRRLNSVRSKKEPRGQTRPVRKASCCTLSGVTPESSTQSRQRAIRKDQTGQARIAPVNRPNKKPRVPAKSLPMMPATPITTSTGNVTVRCPRSTAFAGVIRFAAVMKLKKPPNGGADAAARIHERIAGPIILRNTPPPLASNDLFDRAFVEAYRCRSLKMDRYALQGPVASV
jgi:hypothetical protein